MKSSFDLTDNVVLPTLPATLVSVAVAMGAKKKNLLKNTQIDPRKLGESDYYINYLQFQMLTNNALREVIAPGLGLHFGTEIDVGKLGILGYALMSASSFEHALTMNQKYHKIVRPAVDFDFQIVGSQVIIRAYETLPLGQSHVFAMEAVLSCLINLSRTLFKEPTLANKVKFDFPDPGYINHYNDIAQCPIEFDADFCEVHFDAMLLPMPLALSNSESARLCEQQCDAILSRMGGTEGLLIRIRKLLLENPGRFLSIDDTAERLQTSARTLSRQLKNMGTSFQSVLDSVRKELALDYLQQTEMTIEEIAALLNFSDASNFRKAFKKWTGKAPKSTRDTPP